MSTLPGILINKYIKQVLSDDEFAVFTKYEYEYLVPYADSYEEYKLNIENDYRFTTYLLISDFVQDEEIESIIDSIYEDNYPIKIKIFKEEETVMNQIRVLSIFVEY